MALQPLLIPAYLAMIFLRIDFVLEQDDLAIRQPDVDINTAIRAEVKLRLHVGVLIRVWTESETLAGIGKKIQKGNQERLSLVMTPCGIQQIRDELRMSLFPAVHFEGFKDVESKSRSALLAS